jgi:hypothetical protein
MSQKLFLHVSLQQKNHPRSYCKDQLSVCSILRDNSRKICGLTIDDDMMQNMHPSNDRAWHSRAFHQTEIVCLQPIIALDYVNHRLYRTLLSTLTLCWHHSRSVVGIHESMLVQVTANAWWHPLRPDDACIFGKILASIWARLKEYRWIDQLEVILVLNANTSVLHPLPRKR